MSRGLAVFALSAAEQVPAERAVPVPGSWPQDAFIAESHPACSVIVTAGAMGGSTVPFLCSQMAPAAAAASVAAGSDPAQPQLPELQLRARLGHAGSVAAMERSPSSLLVSGDKCLSTAAA